MFNTDVFNYVNIMDKAADASALRHKAITNNMANVNTPGYKRQDVAFEGILQQALGDFQYSSLDEKVAGVNTKLNRLNARTYTDSAGYSYRLDKNNVDIDTENVELASNQTKYHGLTQSINEEFVMLKTVTK